MSWTERLLFSSMSELCGSLWLGRHECGVVTSLASLCWSSSSDFRYLLRAGSHSPIHSYCASAVVMIVEAAAVNTSHSLVFGNVLQG